MIPGCLSVPARVVATSAHPAAEIAQTLIEHQNNIIFFSVIDAQRRPNDLPICIPVNNARIAERRRAVEI